MRSTARPMLALLAVLLLGVVALVGAGCGQQDHVSTGREGLDVTVGGLDYKVQLARLLNGSASEDSAYLRGQSEPPKGHAYLGVFVRVTNNSDSTQTPSNAFTVVDTKGVSYKPIPIKNAYAYRARPIPPDGQEPPIDTTADVGPTSGAELLFRIDLASVSNDPLLLQFPGPGKEKGEIELDI